jgi:hypothetical protein
MGVYYLRADGTAAVKASAVGPPGDRSRCMSVAVHNRESFAPGDLILLSDQGGTFRQQLTPPSSGDGAADVTYAAVTGEKPLIDVSGSTTRENAIQVRNRDHLTIRGIELMGSGGAAAFLVNGASGTSGYGITVRDVDILSNFGASDFGGNHDGFSVSDTAQVSFADVTADKCRANPADSGSHQCFTAHMSSRIKVLRATCTDSEYGVVVVGDASALIEDSEFSRMLRCALDIGYGATAASTLTVSGGSIRCASGGSPFTNHSVAGTLRIEGALIECTATRSIYLSSDVVLDGCEIVLDDPAFRLSTYGGDLTLTGNHVRLTRVNGCFAQQDRSLPGNITASRNRFAAAPGFADSVFRLRNTTGSTASFDYNQFLACDGKPAIRLEGAGGGVSFYNNTVWNPAYGGIFLDNDFRGQTGAVVELTNNIFQNVKVVADVNTGLSFASNDYYNSENEGGSGSLTTDPLFRVAPAGDFRLQSGSGAIDSGARLGLDTDYTGQGVPVGSGPDMGSVELR